MYSKASSNQNQPFSKARHWDFHVLLYPLRTVSGFSNVPQNFMNREFKGARKRETFCFFGKCFLVCAPRNHFGKQCFLVCGRLKNRRRQQHKRGKIIALYVQHALRTYFIMVIELSGVQFGLKSYV